MRQLLRIASVVGLLVGLVFTGQGAGFIPGSFMTGRIEWAVIGSVLAGLSAMLLWSTFRPR
jgi:hypothetical protein